jgi:xanthine/CO dehydrogenase XdhC/CoxF family maturation factor
VSTDTKSGLTDVFETCATGTLGGKAMGELEGILLSYERVSRAGRIAALASVVSVRGSTYRRIGAHMLVTDDGEVTGAISGGCLERDVVRHAIREPMPTPSHARSESARQE